MRPKPAAQSGIITPVQYNDSVRVIILAAVVLAACTPGSSGMTPAALPLQPYSTITPSATSDQPGVLIVTGETPLPSPTPAQYTIRAGDTLSQIAERFRISLDALLQANPGKDPNALRVGESLQIPASPAEGPGLATPTPAPLSIPQAACHLTANGALWCFVLVRNDTPDVIENVTAEITLVDSAGAVFARKSAVLPLDILPPGASMPLSALFPPPLPSDYLPRVQIFTAIHLLPDDQRYLAASLENTLTEVSWSGYSAVVSGAITLPGGPAKASQVWIVAVAYDELGNINGWRRWESQGDLAPGSSVPFQLMVSSVAGRIDKVDLIVEARRQD